ncbi:hypothetical protein [Okeania sp. SIO2B3]|nr:hypothetical protein [Okeania sp. SIO2B3]
MAGQRKGTWSVKVSGNWRITFKFNGVDASDEMDNDLIGALNE